MSRPRDRLLLEVLDGGLRVFLPITLLLFLVAGLLYRRDLAEERRIHEQEGKRVVDLQAEIISREMRSVRSDLLYLAQQDGLQDVLTGRALKQRLEREYRSFCAHKGSYDQIRFIDEAGRERIRVNDNDGHPVIVAERDLQTKAARYYFDEAMALAPGEIYVSRFDLNVEHDRIEIPPKPVIRFATPVDDERGRRRGILVLNYLGAKLLGKLNEVSHSFSGAVLLLDHEGFFLRGPTRADEWGAALGHDRQFAKSHPAAWERLARAEQGQFLERAGLYTFRAVTPGTRPGGALIAVAHVPETTLRRGSRQLLHKILVVYAGVLPLLATLAAYLSYAGAVRRRHERLIRDSEVRLRTLSTQLLNAQEQERRRISRNLHDDLGQLVTAVCLDLERAARPAEPGKAKVQIDQALAGARLLLERIHEVAASLRPTILDDLGLKQAVRSYLGDYERRTGIGVESELRFERDSLGAEVSENVFRILQEALTNVAKHAGAANVQVRLHVRNGQVELNVKDSGIGFDPRLVEATALGLLGMRERVELLGGEFELTSRKGSGTEIHLTIPLGSA